MRPCFELVIYICHLLVNFCYLFGGKSSPVLLDCYFLMDPFIHSSFKVISRSFQLAEFGSHAWSRCQCAKRKFLVIFDFKETDSAKIQSTGDFLHRQLYVSIAHYCCSLSQVSSETAWTRVSLYAHDLLFAKIRLWFTWTPVMKMTS